MIRLVSRLPRAGGVLSGQLVALACALLALVGWRGAEAFWPGLHAPALLLPPIALAGLVAGRSGGVGCVLLLALLTLGAELSSGGGALKAGEALLLLAVGLLVAWLAGELRHAAENARRLERASEWLERLAEAGSWRWDAAGQGLLLSGHAWRLLGRDPHAGPVSLGHFHTFIHPEDLEALRQAGRRLEQEPVEVAFRPLPAAGGERRVLLLRGEPLPSGGAAGVLVDVTGRHAAEQDRQEALTRQERLYRDLAHRVRNDFQLVSSLLRLQARRAPQEVRTALELAGQRIQSMAALHEALHREGDVGTVSLDRYLEFFSRWITRHWVGRRPVALHLDAIPVTLDGKRALPLGMAVAEMVGNALKHAFPDGRRGNIHVALLREGAELVLSVEDDGAGMEALAVMRSSGFGMTLLQSCARQVEGELLTEHRPRTRFSLRFPEVAPD